MKYTPAELQERIQEKLSLTESASSVEYSFDTTQPRLTEEQRVQTQPGSHHKVRHPKLTITPESHYVYLHFAWTSSDQTILEGDPFYVGQGSHNRPGHFRRCYETHNDQKKTSQNPIRWVDKAKHGFLAWIINNLSQEDANTVEMYLVSLYGRLDEGTGPLCNRTPGGDKRWNRKPATGWHHSEETKAKISKSRKGSVTKESTRNLMSQQRRGVPLTEAHRKSVSQGHLARNQTTPQVRSKCLYCDVVAIPANLATYHNDHCIHRPGYEAINQARRDQVSGERMNRRNQLIEKRRQWLHQTLDTLSPEEKQATGLMNPVKKKGIIQKRWGPIPYQDETTGQWYSVNLKEATRQYKEWVASQDRRN